MDGPTFIIVGQNNESAQKIREGVLKYHGRFPSITIRQVPTCLGGHGPVSAQVAFVEYLGASSLNEMRGLHTLYPSINIIPYSIAEDSKFDMGEVNELTSDPRVKGWITHPRYANGVDFDKQVSDKLDARIVEGGISGKLRLALNGRGHYIKGLIEALNNEVYGPDWVESIDVYSESGLREGGEQWQNDLVTLTNSEGLRVSKKLRFSKSREDFVRQTLNADISVFASGPRTTKYEGEVRGASLEAREFEERLYRGTENKIKGLDPYTMKFDGLALIVANPVERLAHLARKSWDIASNRIYGFGSEGSRAAYLTQGFLLAGWDRNPLLRLLGVDGNTAENSIGVKMFGTHSEPIPALELFELNLKQRGMGGKFETVSAPVKEILAMQEIGIEDVRRSLEDGIKTWAQNTMKGAVRNETDYKQAPNELARVIRCIAHYQQPPISSTIEAWDDLNGVYMHRPTRYDPVNMLFVPDYRAEEKLGRRLKKRIARRIKEQREKLAGWGLL